MPTWGINLTDGDEVKEVHIIIDGTEIDLNVDNPKTQITLTGTTTYKQYNVKCDVKTKKGIELKGGTNIVISKCYKGDDSICRVYKTEDVDNKKKYSFASSSDYKYAITDLNQEPVKLSKIDGYYTLTTSKAAEQIILSQNINSIGVNTKSYLSGSCCIPKIETGRNCKKTNPGNWSLEQTRKYCSASTTKTDGTSVLSYQIDEGAPNTNGYANVEECAKDCRHICDNAVSIKECSLTEQQKVKDSCKACYTGQDYENCVSLKWKEYCSNTILFRPISVYDPFPDSADSPSKITGNRMIGANWVEKSQYITEKDTNYSGTQYVIDLSPGDIRSIRDDNSKSRENNKTDPYSELVCKKNGQVARGKECYGIDGYESNFIHDDYNYLFKDVDGATVPEKK